MSYGCHDEYPVATSSCRFLFNALVNAMKLGTKLDLDRSKKVNFPFSSLRPVPSNNHPVNVVRVTYFCLENSICVRLAIGEGNFFRIQRSTILPSYNWFEQSSRSICNRTTATFIESLETRSFAKKRTHE